MTRRSTDLILHEIWRASHLMLVEVLVTHIAAAEATTTSAHVITSSLSTSRAAFIALLVVPRALRGIVHLDRAAHNHSSIHLMQSLFGLFFALEFDEAETLGNARNRVNYDLGLEDCRVHLLERVQ